MFNPIVVSRRGSNLDRDYLGMDKTFTYFGMFVTRLSPSFSAYVFERNCNAKKLSRSRTELCKRN